MMNFSKGALNLFLTEIGEPSDNELRIVVVEGLLGEPKPIEFAGVALGEGQQIMLTEASRSSEIHWGNYVAYSVRNESYWKPETDEPPLIDHLEQRWNSAFQRYVSETTFACDEIPGPLQHWSLTTLNHIVDVVSVGPPSVLTLQPKA